MQFKGIRLTSGLVLVIRNILLMIWQRKVNKLNCEYANYQKNNVKLNIKANILRHIAYHWGGGTFTPGLNLQIKFSFTLVQVI